MSRPTLPGKQRLISGDVERTVLAAEQATTSGTEFDFTAPLSNVTRAIVMFADVSLDGTDDFLVQLGDDSGIQTASYTAGSIVADRSSGPGSDEIQGAAVTNGFNMESSAAGRLFSGQMHLCLSDAANNGWSSAHFGADTNAGDSIVGGGQRASLNSTLRTIRITRSGTDNFDGGAVNVRWYGF